MGGVTSDTPTSAGDPSLLDLARKQYPILGSMAVNTVRTPLPNDNRMLEFWPPNEAGDKQYPRPQGLPMGQVGVQIISPDTKPSDVAADIVSHYLVNTDPTLKKEYQQFAKTFQTPDEQKRLREDYQWDKTHSGEDRPFDQWTQQTRIPAYLRGYVFQQWPQNTYDKMYTPDQIKLLDAIKATLKRKD